MAFLHVNSCECIKSELDLFSIPPTQTSIEHGQWVSYQPLSSLTDDAPIEFVVPGSGEEYTDLSQTMLHLKARIQKKNAAGGITELVQTDQVAPVNNWLHSLFSQLDIYLNQKLVTPSSNTYAYRSYIETLLNYGVDAKKTHLTSSLWYADNAGKFNTVDEANKGYAARKKAAARSQEVDMIGHLHGDIFNQEKFLVNGVELRVRLVKSRDSFNLMSANGPVNVHITDATLLVRRMRLNPSVLLAHSRGLETSSCKYPVTRTECKVQTIPAGVQGKSLDNIFLGQLPKRIIIGLVSNKAFNGDFKSNPFNFDNFKLNFLSVYLNGQQIPSKPLQPNFNDGGRYIQSYNTLFTGTGIHFSDGGHEITREDYPDGYCLFAFDLTPDLSANAVSHWNLIRQGSLRIELRFDESLAETVNCIVYAEFDNIIEIDKFRNVVTDYGS